jgi:hypothetical protein
MQTFRVCDALASERACQSFRGGRFLASLLSACRAAAAAAAACAARLPNCFLSLLPLVCSESARLIQHPPTPPRSSPPPWWFAIPGLPRRLSAVLWVESPPRSTISHQHRKLNPCFISALPSDPYFRTAKNRSEGLGITLMEHWILPPRASRHGQSPSHVFDCLCRDPRGV